MLYPSIGSKAGCAITSAASAVRSRLSGSKAASPIPPTNSSALPIDAGQERIFSAIDGNRSVGEILRRATGAAGEEQARRFVEQLWEYDHIVFDAIGPQ